MSHKAEACIQDPGLLETSDFEGSSSKMMTDRTDVESIIPVPRMQLTPNGLNCHENLDALTGQFTRQLTIRLPQLLDRQLINMTVPKIEQGTWVPCQHWEVARELLLECPSVLGILHFVFNTPHFLRVIEQITQCGPIAFFQGRVYRKVPGMGHYDLWHDDLKVADRLVGLSLNLGSNPYAGGVFQLRRKNSQELLSELVNVVQGDAILFRIADGLKHRITQMEGTEPKTAFAGWFKSGTRDYFSELQLSSIKPPVTT